MLRQADIAHLNNGAPQQTQEKCPEAPGAMSLKADDQGASVPFSRVTRYSAAVSCARHSLGLLETAARVAAAAGCSSTLLARVRVVKQLLDIANATIMLKTGKDWRRARGLNKGKKRRIIKSRPGMRVAKPSWVCHGRPRDRACTLCDFPE